MRFYIPKYNLPKLEKLVKRLQRKTPIQFEILDDSERQTFVTIDGKRYPYNEIEVDLDLDYKIGNYELIAELEHTPNGNIIRQINPDEQVPDEYKNTNCYCDHCHTNRERKNTFLLLDRDTHEYKQVGKSCLNDYTGYDTLSVAQAASSLYRIFQAAQMNNYDNDPEFMDYLRREYDRYFDLKDMANKFYQLLLDKGYNKENPFEGLEDYHYKPELENKVNELLNVINTDWYQEGNDYCHNVKMVLAMQYIERRHFKILLSYLNSAMKYLQELNNPDKNNEYLGQVGDRIQFYIQSCTVLFTGYDFYSGEDNYTYKFITSKGQVAL